MPERPAKPEGDDEPNVADASWILHDPPAISPSGPAPPQYILDDRDLTDDHGLYGVEGGDEGGTDLDFPVVPVPLGRPSSTRRPKSRKPKKAEIDPAAEVSEVWSRWAEWESTLGLLAMIFLGTSLLVLAAIEFSLYLAGLILMLCGALVMVVMSYPIMVTLERPVRLIPEQALRDYFTALSNHLPHYRRMWLLLSKAAKSSEAFGDFDRFEAYWKRLLAAYNGGTPGRLNTLKFEVAGFDKSAGMNWVDIRYELRIYRRTPKFEAMIASYTLETSVVRGPDRMWYLTEGTIPPPDSDAEDIPPPTPEAVAHQEA